MKANLRISAILVGAFILSLIGPHVGKAAAQSVEETIYPVSYTTQRGGTGGQPVEVLSVMDQTGTTDNPADYVTFTTPKKTYAGTHLFQMPAGVTPASINTMKLTVNYKGPKIPSQRWSWFAYNYKKKVWVGIGYNKAVTSSNDWTQLEFVMNQPVRFVNAKGEMRIQFRSNNATGDAKLDYEAITFSALPGAPSVTPPTPTSSPTITPPPTVTPSPTMTPAPTITPSPTTPPSQSGNTYYVSPQGNDANPGTQAAPWKTIQKAVSAVTAGDTIYLRGGIYYLTGTIRLDGTGPNGTKDKPIRLWNYPGETPILDGSNLTQGVSGITMANKD